MAKSGPVKHEFLVLAWAVPPLLCIWMPAKSTISGLQTRQQTGVRQNKLLHIPQSDSAGAGDSCGSSNGLPNDRHFVSGRG